MNIAVNTRLLLKGRLEGIGRFTHEVMRRVCVEMPEHKFHFFFDRPFDEEFIYAENVTGHTLFPQARHPILYKWWFEHSIPAKLKKVNADLFFSPEGYLSLKTPVPSVNVMHDINFEHHPEMHGKAHLNHFKKYFPLYAHKASEVMTVSEFSKSDIVKLYGVDKEKISVVYNGVSDNFRSSSVEIQQTTCKNWSGGEPYFVFVGSIHPRKNLVRLLHAFDQFKKKTKLSHRLIIIGKKAFMNEDLEMTFEKMDFKSDVIFTGRLEEEEMIHLMSAAQALTFVPVFEGFGMPIIEAFKCEVPVITSDVTALPEIAGDAAILVDPLKTEDITEAMIRISTDETLRAELIIKGIIRAQEFTWDKAAAQVKKTLLFHLG